MTVQFQAMLAFNFSTDMEKRKTRG